MNLLMPARIDIQKPVLEIFEEGDWMRIEVQGRPTRYMRKALAQKMLIQIRQHSVGEKSDLSVL